MFHHLKFKSHILIMPTIYTVGKQEKARGLYNQQ